MGMTIDKAIKELITMRGGLKYALTIPIYSDEDKEDREIDKVQLEAIIMAIDTMRKYQLMQADYNARLKADMVAMLTELQLEIEESCICAYEVTKLIKQKINALKADRSEEQIGGNT